MVLHRPAAPPRSHGLKAKSEERRRLHTDKALLRFGREDFAQLMREQGIAANATPRVVHGRNKGNRPGRFYEFHGSAHPPSPTRASPKSPPPLHAPNLSDLSLTRLFETRKAILSAWLNVADSLDIQGDHTLASDLRHFARRLPRVLRDGERIAAALVAHSPQRQTNETTLDNTGNKARDFIW